jgi:hypothetical protein
MPVSPASPESLPAPLLPPSRTSLAVPARRPAHAAVGHVQATAAESAIRAAGPFHTANAPQIRAGHLYWPTICHQCCKLVDGSSIYCGCWRPDPGAGHPAARLQCSLRQPGFPTGAGISERCPAPRPGRQAEPVSPLQPAAWTRPTYNQSLTDTTLCGHTDTLEARTARRIPKGAALQICGGHAYCPRFAIAVSRAWVRATQGVQACWPRAMAMRKGTARCSLGMLPAIISA